MRVRKIRVEPVERFLDDLRRMRYASADPMIFKEGSVMNKKRLKIALAVGLALLFSFGAVLTVSAAADAPNMIAPPEFHLPLPERVIAANIPVISEIAAFVFSAIYSLFLLFRF